MTKALALKYRPQTFDEIVGQRAVSVVLKQMALKDSLPVAMLLEGARGCGKTSAARIVAAAVNCDTTPGPCGHCVSCKAVFAGTSLDVVEVDAASNGLVADIRALREQVMYSVGGKTRVVLLDEVHSVSNAGFNALLKTLEEPPPHTMFILLTTERHKVLGTVLSRCMPFSFRKIGITDLVARLTTICTAEGLDVEPALLSAIAEHADGGMRDAVMTLDQVTAVGVRTVAQYRDLIGDSDYAPPLFDALLRRDPAAVFQLADTQLETLGDPATLAAALVKLFRDLLVLQAGGTLGALGEALETRKRLAQRTDSASLLAALRVLWDLRRSASFLDDKRAALDLALAMTMQALTKEPATTSNSNGNGHKKLTLVEMKARAAR